MRKTLTKRLLFFDGILLFITILYTIAFSFSQKYGLGIFDCSFLYAFGFPCPGCGGSRAVLSLIYFRPIASFFFNPTVLLALILFIIHNALCIISIIKNDRKYINKFKLEIYVLLPVTLILNFILRIVLLKYGIDVINFASSLSF